ncbi:MAG: aspartate--tRNA ligase [Fimbriimonadaceae bacterium]|nr:aspartate--tRNA ligase [Alphaproteobacteria bacterium]
MQANKLQDRYREMGEMHRYRSHTCGEIRKTDVDSNVRVSGWVHRVRDHGGLLFIDLRDHYGITQCVADPDSPAFSLVETVRAEWVIRIDGVVKARDGEAINPALPTGEVEIFINELEVLSQSPELPMPVFGEQEYPEDTRLKYRFLDLRRERIHNNIMKRGAIISSIRERMKTEGFFEFQTPILTASSPEGARDFLVPSRLHPGKFYALPQAPQQFKQLIMMAGFDRYFQIAPCFRDEDARADRSPGEFYQLDIEMSFVTQDDVFEVVEPVLRGLFEEFGDGKSVTQTFPHIPYAEAMQKYGTDKPDLRNPIEMQDVTETFRGSGFKIFAGMIEKDDKVRVWAIPAKTGGSRAFCDRMNSWAQGEGQPGLGYIFWRSERLPDEAFDDLNHPLRQLSEQQQLPAGGENAEYTRMDANTYLAGAGPVAKNIGAERTEGVRQQLGLEDGDAVFFVAGDPKKFAGFAGAARTRAGEELDLIAKDRFDFCWIVDFPMFEWNEEDKKVDFSHNPFSMPQGGLEALENDDPLTIKAWQYDIVCNGIELSSGAIRNHRPEIMKKAFEIAGYEESVLEEEFGGMLRALTFGAPPHGGIAPGIDRIVMLLCGEENLREVVMFPMNQQAEDLLMGAPSEVSARQLRELHIRLNLPKP